MKNSSMSERIDSHHHLWRYTREDYGWISPQMGVLKRDFMPQDLYPEMHRARLTGSVVVQARQSIAETRWLLELATSTPWIRGVVGWAPIASADFGTVLDDLLGSAKLRGLRHVIQDEPNDDFILSDDFNSGIASMLGTGLVYDLLIHERHLPCAAEFARRHPQQAFVLDHVAKPRIRENGLEPWKKNLLELASYPNVFCKLSGLATEADWTSWTFEDLKPYLDAALEAFGPERLMAGSDWPVCLVATSYARWWDSLEQWARCLNSAQQDALFGGTATEVYRLEDVDGSVK